MDWVETNSYLRGIKNTVDNVKKPLRVASFDLDDTLIHRPTSRSKDTKWQLLDPSIATKIADLVEQRFVIIVFTNQGGMSLNKNFDQPKWRKTMDDLVDLLTSEITNGEFYFAVYVSKKYDIYRKPNIGLWKKFKDDIKEEFNFDTKLGISDKSFYCGDAAGRVKNSTYRKSIYPNSTKQGDHSDTDRKFAMNIGIQFVTPEEFFLGEEPDPNFKLLGLDPENYLQALKSVSRSKSKTPKIITFNIDYKQTANIEISADDEYTFTPRKVEMILMVGPMGSGKSQYAQNYIVPHGYAYVNQDTCKTKTKCDELTKAALEKNKSVVIDATNPDVLTRMHYTTMAKDFGYKHIRAIVMNTPQVIFNHLNNVRHLHSDGKIAKIHSIAYSSFNKKYVKPLKSEHFDKIDHVNFIFDTDQLSDPKWKQKFLLWSEF